MAFMKLYVYDKGVLHTADCAQCGSPIFHHEWIGDYDTQPDAMRAGTAPCPQCANGRADPSTVRRVPGLHYAARYSADGYMDCTEWHYGTNKRELIREVRGLYGN